MRRAKLFAPRVPAKFRGESTDSPAPWRRRGGGGATGIGAANAASLRDSRLRWDPFSVPLTRDSVEPKGSHPRRGEHKGEGGVVGRLGFEPRTNNLKGCCSTSELSPPGTQQNAGNTFRQPELASPFCQPPPNHRRKFGRQSPPRVASRDHLGTLILQL